MNEYGWCLDDYMIHMRSIRNKLPQKTREFVFAPWHYDGHHPHSPYASWVENVSIIEAGSGDRRQHRNIDIKATFLGGLHNGYFEIIYSKVQSYLLDLKQSPTDDPIGHGDWIIDEILLLKDGYVSHEIIFSSGLWNVVCADIAHRWLNV